ncbi:MAG: ABC-type Fe3+-hydroxamate transport system, periplasmic component [Flavipsychrobacter sp.]|jgi:ABC-type Fe3+-hydroxamate transport system substrate-binding protein|nr:ABC-type Fe3+-hydroxamate transport system, periplasmic component [Flavipsychrobacter sp.]
MKQISITDMLGNVVTLNYPPKRIISFVPSQTELLFDLGLDEEVVGITKFCVHPETWFRSKKRIGGTKTVHIDIVRSLQPDLIIANKEENTKEQVEELSALYPTWVSNIQTIEEGLQMIQEVGILVGKEEQANTIVQDIRQGFSALTKPLRQAKDNKRVAYFIWRNPWMCAGGDTFISDMLSTMGWYNVLADRMRYPEVTLDELKGKNVDVVLLSSEPYPFKDPHIAEIKEALPNAEVKLVDGEMMSWYGSRMRLATEYVKTLIG